VRPVVRPDATAVHTLRPTEHARRRAAGQLDRGVDLVNFDLGGNGFRDLGPSNGELAPPSTACSRAGGGCGTGSPPPTEGVRWCHPRNFFEIFDAKSRVWGAI